MLELLKGIRILDLTSVVLGPYATQMLGDLGAEVIKIEPRGGDLFRYVRPGRSAEMGAGFLNCNRNKSSLAIDLKQKEGLEVLHKLVGSADIVVHNMRPASARELGISYEQLSEINPRLVYCCAPGFGQYGPYADAPAYDDIIQAASGLAYLNRNAEGEPRFVPTIACDKIGGLHLVVAALGGLVRRLQSGKGCSIEAPMFESMVSFLMVEQLSGQSFVPPLGPTGYERLQSPHRRPFRTADGYIAILPYNTKHWTAFFAIIGRSDLAQDALITDPVLRSQAVGDLYRIIAEATPSRTSQAWLTALQTADVPCGLVTQIEDLFDDPHLKQIGFFTEFDHPTEGRLRKTNTPFTAEGCETSPDRPAPRLGENSAEILRMAGIDDAACATLVANRVIVISPISGDVVTGAH